MQVLPTPAFAPTAPGERIEALDILRGFALAGIALVNVEFFSRPLQDINADGVDPSTRGADYLVEWLTYFFAQGKFWTLFALLFGMGFAVMIDRAGHAGRPFVAVYLRRSLALLGIGAVHALLIWSGDILVSYALGALLLLLARQLRRAWLRLRGPSPPTPMPAARMARWGAALYGLPLALLLLVGAVSSLSGAAPTPEERKEHAATLAEEAAQRAQAVTAYRQGDLGDALVQRVADTLWQLGTLPVFMFWLAGVFLIGGAILRSGVLAEPDRQRAWLLRTRNLGLPIGFAAMAASIALGTASPQDRIDFADAVQVTLFLVASLVLALAYGATVLCALRGGAGPWLRRWLAPMGRMALSNYLLQSVIGTLLFYAYGFGLWGQVGRAAQAAGVVVVLVAQAWASRWWLARFRYGPAEWVWRCATYWRVVPLRAGA